MTISDFFDANKKSHRDAFEYFTVNHIWPKDFLPDEVRFSISWPYDVSIKMVDYLMAENKRLTVLLNKLYR